MSHTSTFLISHAVLPKVAGMPHANENDIIQLKTLDIILYSVKQNEAQCTCAVSTHMGVNLHSKDERGCSSGGVYVPCIYSHAR